jgi:hypothetical protein
MSLGCGWRDDLLLWRVAASVIHKQLQTNNKGWPSDLGIGHGAKTPHHKNKHVMKDSYKPQTWADTLDKRTKRWNMNMRFRNGMYEVCPGRAS